MRFHFWSDNPTIRAAQYAGITLAVMLLVAVAVIVVRKPAVPLKREGRPALHNVVEVKLPLLTPVMRREDAFTLPQDIVVPPDAIVRFRGKLRSGKRTGGSRIVVEARVPRADSDGALTGNGVSTVRLQKDADREFEVLLHQPRVARRPATLEFRLGDEYLAKGRIVVSP